jgi:hypothetical protein
MEEVFTCQVTLKVTPGSLSLPCSVIPVCNEVKILCHIVPLPWCSAQVHGTKLPWSEPSATIAQINPSSLCYSLRYFGHRDWKNTQGNGHIHLYYILKVPKTKVYSRNVLIEFSHVSKLRHKGWDTVDLRKSRWWQSQQQLGTKYR